MILYFYNLYLKILFIINLYFIKIILAILILNLKNIYI